MAAEGPLTAAEIYDQITNGVGTQSLSDAHSSADQLTKKMADRAIRIYALSQKTMSGWQGGAGQAAADSTTPLVQASADDAAHLARAQHAVSSQMDAFGTAKNSVKPVAAQPPEFTSDDIVSLLNGKNSYDTKVQSWQADSQANIDAFSSYHSASSTNGGQMPAQYAQLTDSGAPISMEQPGESSKGKTGGFTGKDVGPGDTSRGQDGRQGQQTFVPSQQTQTPGQTPNRPPGQDPSGGLHPPGGATPSSDNTEANHYVPKPIAPPPVNQGYQFGPTGQPISPVGGGNPNYGGGYGPYGGFGPGTGGGPGSTGGYRTGSGAVNEPGTRGPGSGSGGRMPDERMPGGGRGMGPGGAAGARGANGMPMGAGGGKGKKEEDKEKKAASYLQNPDPDETFGGSDLRPMPPVIGEKQPKK